MNQLDFALPVVAPRELIVVTRPDAELRVVNKVARSLGGYPVEGLNNTLAHPEWSLKPLFGISEERLKLQRRSIPAPPAKSLDPANFYRLYAPDQDLEMLAQRMLQEPAVEAVYIKPIAEVPIFRDIIADVTQPPVPTGDFRPLQVYLLDALSGGIDANFASQLDGGKGLGVKIIDVEAAWRFTHEDLRQNSCGVVGGTALDSRFLRNHGTAVIGIISGDDNGFGIIGICPEASISGISQFGPAQGWGTAAAIYLAADKLDQGDIILLELQRRGPNSTLIPVEWWPDDMVAIQYATQQRGVLVVAAGANGGVSLDDNIFDYGPTEPFSGFPPNWHNPFRRNPVDTGSIIVGAGAAPGAAPGTSTTPDRCRLGQSNFGSIFDAQGYGECVASCGFGNIGAGGSDEDFYYTDDFNGTSSAAPMVAGALACVQGIRKASGLIPLTPLQARALLRATGCPQQEDANSPPISERIGNRPNLKEMIEAMI